MGEMGGGSVYGVLAQNILFQGGDVGYDSAMLLHSCGEDISLSNEGNDNSSVVLRFESGCCCLRCYYISYIRLDCSSFVSTQRFLLHA